MASQEKIVLLEKVGENKDIIKIRFVKDIPPSRSVPYLTAALGKCFQNCFYKIILDLQQLTHVNDRFVATLLEATAKVRRENGDIKLINMTTPVLQAISDFNAYMYFSITSEEEE